MFVFMSNNKPNTEFHFPPKNENDLGNEHDKIASDYRGKIIHYVTELEDWMNAIITEYFIKDNFDVRTSFEHVVINEERFNLHFKFVTIAYLVKHPFKPFGDLNPHHLSVLEGLIKIRNKYAHHGFINKSAINPKKLPPLRLNKLSNSRTPKTDFVFLDEENLKVFYGDCFAVREYLKDFLKLIYKTNEKREHNQNS